jgi:hypothetical protein
MTENLKKYLIDDLWTKYDKSHGWPEFWTKDTCDECYYTITNHEESQTFVFSEDCPDIWRKAEDFPPDTVFNSEEELIRFLEFIKWG